MKDSIRLCLSLYACEPNLGSEPGVGWAWALGMAKRHDTWVLTRANNRNIIEEELDRLATPESERPHFVWVDLPKWIQRLKKKGIVPVSLYYLLWQFAARRAWDRTGIRVDVIHHVTFNTFAIPGVWWHRQEKVVLGPLGGMSICPRAFLRSFPFFARIREAIRGLFCRLWFLNLLYLFARRYADALIFTTDDIRKKLARRKDRSWVFLETAIPTRLECRGNCMPSKRRSRRFIWAGSLEGRKAGDIAIRAFAHAFHDTVDPPVLEMIGDGILAHRWRRLAATLHAEPIIRFTGRATQEDLWEKTSDSLAFVFTSVRDTSGNVALESLALGTPVICFRHQGVAEIVDDTCGILVEPSSYNDGVADFAAAMRLIAENPNHANRLGEAGRKRVMEKFTWKQKFDAVDSVYRTVLSQEGVNGVRHSTPCHEQSGCPPCCFPGTLQENHIPH